MRHGLKRENGVCSGLWSWELLILERTSPWHCLWRQLQCICHQVYRFLNLPPSAQCMMTQKCSSACNTPYDLRCVASYQPPPSYFYPTGKTRASINAYRALVRDNPIYCITLGYIPKTKLTYAMPTSWKGVQRNFPYHTWTWILWYYCCLEQRSTIVFNWCLTELAANTAKEYPRSSLGKKSVPCKRGHRPHHQPCLPPVL